MSGYAAVLIFLGLVWFGLAIAHVGNQIRLGLEALGAHLRLKDK